ncbi:T9SS type A sorting domain-containing protein [Nonlabens ponticola]|uniref:T9SS type A sorting domain-containing protein n=1 Tax=Nonlabens ponticola TaxID=2496866 RepID=A0A3S9MUX6_9FLAO|nr:T9SS type A sorting domain-containing protein [Nonlabens ponticola]AZQ42977.1 T9SS type A sorting domain-containing protein [Nonlabens ponticola]
MKIFTIVCLLMLPLFGVAQIGTDAPWMTDITPAKNANGITYDQVKSAGEAYWASHDKDAKGSGYKPFMRWLERAKPFLNADGTLQTVSQLQEIIESSNIAKSSNDDSQWNPVGPFDYKHTSSWSPGQGRTNTIAVDPNNPDIYYLGTPAGGMWKSTNAGIDWTPRTDFLSQIGVSAIAVDKNNSDIIYIGTGDDDAGDTASIGLLKSTDGGETFNETGLSFTGYDARISEVYIDPTNSRKILIASSRGFYVSNNAGTTVTKTFNGNIKDVKLNPSNPDMIYLATNSAFYRSMDGGSTFTQITSGLPATGISRIVIGVTAADANRVYLLAITNNGSLAGLYKSRNAGSTFSRTDDGTDILESTQGWYDLALEVSQTDEDVVYTGCLNVWKSSNGGRSFDRINTWNNPASSTYTHADIHQIREFDGELYVMSDGGIYRSTNNGRSFTDLTAGLQIGQFYRVAVGSDSSSNMAGGLQDNGGYTSSNGTWKNYHGADGMEAGVSPLDSNVRYGFSQFGGGLYVTSNSGETYSAIAGPEQGNWITPLKTNSKGDIYAGYKSLYKVEQGQFVAQSNAFAENLSVIEINPINDDIIYVAYDRQLFRSVDAGVNFTWLVEMPGPITAIEVNNNNDNTVYVSTAYSIGQVMRSDDMGMTFTDITSNLPQIGKNTIAHHINSADDALFLGTTIGVYKYDSVAGTWSKFANNLPNVSVTDLEINPVDQILTAATYGRGIWQTAVTPVSPQMDLSLQSVESTTGKIDCTDLGLRLQVSNNGLQDIDNFTITRTIGNDIIAQNFDMSIVAGQQQEIILSELNLPPGSYMVRVEVSTDGDAFLGNNFKERQFIQNQGSRIGDTYEFEQRSLVSVNSRGNESLWERGVPNGSILKDAESGRQVYGTNLNGNYPDLTKSFLYTGCYNFSNASNLVLEFDMAYDLEENWDVMYVEYSIDHGANWSLLGDASSETWYNSDRGPDGSNCFNCPGGQWTGTDSEMKPYATSLRNLAGQQDVVFRFVFESDQSVNNEGVILDNLKVTGTLNNASETSVDFAIFPNPSSGIFNINWKSDADYSITVHDLTGKMVLQQDAGANKNSTVNLEDMATGMYFMTITSGGNSATRKLIKR